MNEKPNYYSIIPAKVRYDKNLKPMEKIMFSEISALSNSNGYCHAGNAYFANLYDKSKSTISVWINDLKRNNHIRIKYEHEGKQIIERKIYPMMDNIPKAQEVSLEKSKGYLEKSNGGYLEKSKNPISKNLKDNITSINTTSNNIYNNNSEVEKTNTPNVYEVFESEICRLNGFQRPQFTDWLQEFGSDVIMLAIKHICTTDLRTTWGTFNWLMKRWHDHNLKTVDEIKDFEKQEHERNKAKKQGFKKQYQSHSKKGSSFKPSDYEATQRKIDETGLPF